MRALIVNPPAVDGVGFVREGRCEQRTASFQYLMVPISLPSTAAVLREAGHDVGLIDCIADEIGVTELGERIRAFEPDLVLFSFSTVTFDSDAQVTRELRPLTPAHFTAIGVHVTTLAEESLASSALDSIVRREPEYTARALADALDAGTPLDEVLGLSWRDGEAIVHNEDRPFIEDLDALPFPARDLLHNERYVAPLTDKPQTLVVTSRGCPFSCIYCTAHCYYGRTPRMRSAVNVVDEIEDVRTRLGIREITMWSDTFTFDERFVLEVCDEIERRELDINWMCNSRVDTVNLEMLKRMKRAGCSVMSYGVESGVQEILDNIKKGTTVEKIARAFAWTREAGIESMAHIILGLPGETPETIEATKRFVRRIRPDYVQFYCAVPFPGTQFYAMARDKGWLITSEWSRFEINQAIISTEDLTAEQLDTERQRAFRGFYLRPTYIAAKLGRIKSLEDARRLVRGGIDFLKAWVMGS